ncbi:PALP-domain-containing protein [Fragilariopsis cylindrus CCMP1102]|uniref:PALP-domain-containing protein n=1 Tax=Fragilariopsis cylindrus CCMP1102 TaxID=635003 RepID=A0A1E7FXE5_9STRA|nr:PALP-domain-containing protein [Fragilariopsis cylindrus CCMP1102]|eukprot:OEU22832.1 PALP-domain-containing protein [Fragilariopsis cylindrus CCMP1102]
MTSIFKLDRGRISNTSCLIFGGIGLTAVWISHEWRRRSSSRSRRYQEQQLGEDDVIDSISSTTLTAHEQLIEGGTPLIKLRLVSKLIGRTIYVKMESMNPGGTGKDRPALNMIRMAEKEGNRTGGLVVEGTSGSTGIALATLCASRGHACLVVLPDDQAVEKQRILRALGAIVYEVPTASISNPKHYVNLGRKAALLAREKFGISAVFIDQFENLSNFDIHYRQTGPELWKQLDGRRLDAFCMSSGTGGTISGMASFLKEKKKQNRQKNNYRNHLHNLLRIIGLYYFDDNNDDNVRIKIVLVEPPGSVLYNKVEHGVAYAVEQRERSLRKHRYDTIAEGIGLDRVTRNFSSGFDCIDSAIRVTDQEAVDMAHWILHIEGLWIGSSSAMNVVGAIRTALSLPEGSSVATIICDGGQRHATRFWDPTFIKKWGLQWPGTDCIPECLQSIQN